MALGVFGKTKLGSCGIKDTGLSGFITKLGLQYLVVFPCLIYYFITCIRVFFKRDHTDFSDPEVTPPPAQDLAGLETTRSSARYTALNSALLPMICVHTTGAFLTDELASDVAGRTIPYFKPITELVTSVGGF
ncbi:hypothetical protein L0F63_005955 [Massospora cicadina]|nr:hypothetical protein L0F63_005955 [Massospora cicadina]